MKNFSLVLVFFCSATCYGVTFENCDSENKNKILEAHSYMVKNVGDAFVVANRSPKIGLGDWKYSRFMRESKKVKYICKSEKSGYCKPKELAVLEINLWGRTNKEINICVDNIKASHKKLSKEKASCSLVKTLSRQNAYIARFWYSRLKYRARRCESDEVCAFTNAMSYTCRLKKGIFLKN